MAKARTLSRQTLRELKALLKYWRQQPRLGAGDRGPPVDNNGDRLIRWCRTTTGTVNGVAWPTYPTDPDTTTFVAEFGDYTYDNTTVGVVTPTFTPYVPEFKRIVISHVGFLTEGSIKIATQHKGLAGQQKGSWHIEGSGSSECNVVRFIVVSADPTTRTALGEIKSRPVGCSDVPESTLNGTVIEICDPQGCFFNEPNVDLTGRHGWARYMMPVTENVCQPDPAYLVPQWEVFALCCHIEECDV